MPTNSDVGMPKKTADTAGKRAERLFSRSTNIHKYLSVPCVVYILLYFPIDGNIHTTKAKGEKKMLYIVRVKEDGETYEYHYGNLRHARIHRDELEEPGADVTIHRYENGIETKVE